MPLFLERILGAAFIGGPSHFGASIRIAQVLDWWIEIADWLQQLKLSKAQPLKPLLKFSSPTWDWVGQPARLGKADGGRISLAMLRNVPAWPQSSLVFPPRVARSPSP
jgi:hypothetical protein